MPPFESRDFAAAMAQCLASGAPWPGVVAVSGGGDSVALMLLLVEWAAASGRARPEVLTVDHDLREGSANIARGVVKMARLMGLKAHKLVWTGPKPTADLEAAARSARYALMGNWCKGHKICGLYVAHTLEDQAETFLLRLARGSGLDGLAAMRAVSPYPLPQFEALRVVRPLLDASRERLRGFLADRGKSWSEDPMNSDPRFARVRIRSAWPKLAELGFSAARIAAAASHLARARDALDAATNQFFEDACRVEKDRVLLDGARLASLPPEIGLRVLARVLSRVSGETYRPRFKRLEKLHAAIVAGGGLVSARTLHGCRVGRAAKRLSVYGPASLAVTREPPRGKQKGSGVAVHKQTS